MKLASHLHKQTVFVYLFVCLVVCLVVCLFVGLFDCLFVSGDNKLFRNQEIVVAAGQPSSAAGGG